MESLNRTLFLLLNAPADPPPLLIALAHIFAQWAIWLVPFWLTLGWLRGDDRLRRLLLQAAAAGVAGLLINQLIGLFWQHQRPFMIGLGHTFLEHAPDSSFPSDHLTLCWSVAFSLLLQQKTRSAGLFLTLLGLPVAWARIYLGVHFPLDMAGAALVAVVSALLLHHEDRAITRLHRLLTGYYRQLAAPLIRRGLLR